jgi:hypothetical protein
VDVNLSGTNACLIFEQIKSVSIVFPIQVANGVLSPSICILLHMKPVKLLKNRLVELAVVESVLSTVFEVVVPSKF